ncbi:MAG: type II toxin-antitoxin system Phd/YefM family antitoxin [Cyanobium sp.]
MRPVTRTVGAFEAKTHLAALLDAVAGGEQITITRSSDQLDSDGHGQGPLLMLDHAGDPGGWPASAGRR